MKTRPMKNYEIPRFKRIAYRFLASRQTMKERKLFGLLLFRICLGNDLDAVLTPKA